MHKQEYPPLFPEGFREISIWQLDGVFLEPFSDNAHRKYLIDRFNVFIDEFKSIGIEAEI